MDFFDMLVSILGSTVRLTIPLLFTALAGLFSERAGVFGGGLPRPRAENSAQHLRLLCLCRTTVFPRCGFRERPSPRRHRQP